MEPMKTELPCRGPIYAKSREWYDKTGPGELYNLQVLSGIITRDEYFKRFEEFFHCKLEFLDNKFTPSQMVFEEEQHVTYFLLKFG